MQVRTFLDYLRRWAAPGTARKSWGVNEGVERGSSPKAMTATRMAMTRKRGWMFPPSLLPACPAATPASAGFDFTGEAFLAPAGPSGAASLSPWKFCAYQSEYLCLLCVHAASHGKFLVATRHSGRQQRREEG